MTPEQEIIADLRQATEALVASSREALELVGPMPGDAAAFRALTPVHPGDEAQRLARMNEAVAALPFLFKATARADRVIAERGLLHSDGASE